MRRGTQQFRGKSSRNRLREDLKRAIDPLSFIVDEIGGRNVREENEEIVFSCPLPWGLHKTGDTNPSSAFNREYFVWNCFLCGGGDIFWLLQNVFDITFEESVERLSQYLEPRELSKDELLAELEAMWKEDEIESYSLPRYSPRLLTPWKRYSPYFSNRGIGEEIQREFSLGVDLKNKEQVKIGTEEVWIESPRVVIPHFYGGELRGWLKRKVLSEQPGPKYRNSKGFPKKETLYAWDVVDEKSLIVVESTLSVLYMRQLGYRNVVATFGAKVVEDQIRLLRSVDDITLFMDIDPEGKRATEALVDKLSSFSKVWVANCTEEGKDPADLSFKELEKSLSDRVPGVLWDAK